jgi:hypothetical protein
MKTLSVCFSIISIALVLSFSLPCYAQVDTDGLLLPENTGWRIQNPRMGLSDPHLGFWGGGLMFCDGDVRTCYAYAESQYQNLPISKFGGYYCSDYTIPGTTACYYVSGIVIPFLWIGRMTCCVTTEPGEDYCFDSLLTRDYSFIH